MLPHGVIFDMDGVLIDSHDAHFESWRLTAEERGLSISPEQFSRTFGRTSRETIALVWDDQELSSDVILAMDAQKERFFRKILADSLPIMPGLLPLLSQLRDGGGIGWPLDLRAHIEFDAVITGDDVQRGKPDPQVFLLAAKKWAFLHKTARL